MKVPIWVHTVDTAYRGTATLPPDDRKLPFSAVYQKVVDGLTLQGRWDQHPSGIDSIEDVTRADRDIYGEQGIGWIPWGVVHGRWDGADDNYARSEGALAGQVAQAAAADGERAVFIVDLEPSYFAPFPAFWRDDLNAGPREIRNYMEGFVSTGGEELWIAVDPREAHFAPVSLGSWATRTDLVKRVLPMVYFTDFVAPRVATVEDALSTLRAARDVFARYGVGEARLYPILPAPAQRRVMTEAIIEAERLGFGGVSVYQRGNLSLETAEAIAALDDPWAARPDEPTEEPPFNVADAKATLALLGRAADMLVDTSSRLSGLATNVREIRQQLKEDLGIGPG